VGENSPNLGPMLCSFKYFRRKFQRKNWRFLTQNKAKSMQNFDHTLVFEKNAIFFAENCRKSQKIVIVTSTPGHTGVNESLLDLFVEVVDGHVDTRDLGSEQVLQQQ
jgi:hypothetical protein